jgi:pilus assembly protein FimV
MPLHTAKKFPLSRLKRLSVAVSLALALPVSAHAANLGKLTVLSSLGQPLRAEIELTSVSKDEEGKLVARLANGEAFRKANIDVNPILSSLRFYVEKRSNRQFVRIVSGEPINEPFVDLLLELMSPASRQVREYTFLLDPPEMRKPQTAQAAPAAPAAPAVVTPPATTRTPAAAEAKPMAAAKPVTSAPTPTAAPVETAAMPAVLPTPAAPAIAAVAEEEPVSQIETKDAPSKVAEDLMRDGRSTQSEASNAPVPEAVAEKLAAPAAPATKTGKRGQRNAVANTGAEKTAEKPAGDQSYRVKEGDTLAQIAARTKDNTVSLDQMLVALYRANPDAFISKNINRLRAGRVLSLPDADAAGQVDKGEARTTVLAQAQDFNAYRNKLAGQVASGTAREAGESKQSGRGKVTARVEEKSGGSEVKDKLQLSKSGAGTGAADKAAAERAAEDKIAADKAIAEANARVKELEKNVSDLQKLLELKNKSLAEMSEQQKAAAQPAAPAPAPEPAKPAEPVAAAEPATPPAVAEVKPAPAPVPAAAPAMKTQPAPKPVAKPGFFEHIGDNPFAIPAAGLLVVLLAALGFMRTRNQNKPAAPAKGKSGKDKPVKEPELTEPEPVVPAAVVAAAVAAPVEPVIAPEVLHEPEPVDPIAEAEMYIAYGRDEQAEDILRLALKTEPNRQAIRLKLLEIYSKRQDVAGFNDIARELHDATGGTGGDWEQASAMGILLDPTNPLYGGEADDEEDVMQAIDLDALAQPNPDTDVAEVAEPEVPAEETGLEFDLSDFKAAEVTPGDPVADIGSKIDFDLELDGEAKADAAAVPPVAAATPAAAPIDLDLPEPAEAPVPDALEDEESAFAAEMSTKLDLAAAYQEIGDREGARELLDEVIRGGSASQIERAKDMLSKL